MTVDAIPVQPWEAPAPITSADAAQIVELGDVMIKQPSPVHMLKMPVSFRVQTNEGVLTGKAGDYVAYDPKSGHVWPVSAEYVGMHYRVAAADVRPER